MGVEADAGQHVSHLLEDQEDRYDRQQLGKNLHEQQGQQSHPAAFEAEATESVCRHGGEQQTDERHDERYPPRGPQPSQEREFGGIVEDAS